MGLSRRSFLVCSGMALGVLAGAPRPAGAVKKKIRAGSKRIWRLSVRGRRTSNAAKEFCANLRFATQRAAMLHPLPHPGINARVVPLDASLNEFWRLFIKRRRLWADLRVLGGPPR